MSLRRILRISLFLVFAAFITFTGVVSLQGSAERPRNHFDAHEFAVFRSAYDSLRTETISSRVEHFRNLVEATETARLTAGMADNLGQYCRDVIASDEATEVKAQAYLILNTLERRAAAFVTSDRRSPGSLN